MILYELFLSEPSFALTICIVSQYVSMPFYVVLIFSMYLTIFTKNALSEIPITVFGIGIKKMHI